MQLFQEGAKTGSAENIYLEKNQKCWARRIVFVNAWVCGRIRGWRQERKAGWQSRPRCNLESLRAKSLELWPTLWDPMGHQAALSMGFSRQESWSGLPFPPLGDLPSPETEPGSLTSAAGGFLITSTTWEAHGIPGAPFAFVWYFKIRTKKCVPKHGELCILSFEFLNFGNC